MLHDGELGQDLHLVHLDQPCHHLRHVRSKSDQIKSNPRSTKATSSLFFGVTKACSFLVHMVEKCGLGCTELARHMPCPPHAVRSP